MRHALLATAAFCAAVCAHGLIPTPAAADSTYHKSMRSFAPDIARWAGGLQELVTVATVKPDVACGEELAEAARIGVWIGQDLVGMAPLAPTGLAAAHAELTAAAFDFAGAARAACDDAAGAAAAVDAGWEGYQNALAKLLNYTSPRGRGGVVPGLPGSDD